MQSSGLIELDAVVAVARHRNFRAAALELGVSRSAISHAVAALEERLGVRLFNRTTRSVSPTEAGEQFVTSVAPALGDIREPWRRRTTAGRRRQARSASIPAPGPLGR
jgi:DNA-binding transcriptional LysR family regulator